MGACEAWMADLDDQAPALPCWHPEGLAGGADSRLHIGFGIGLG